MRRAVTLSGFSMRMLTRPPFRTTNQDQQMLDVLDVLMAALTDARERVAIA